MNRLYPLCRVFVLSTALLVVNLSAIAQSTGDYRSNNSGNWSTLNTWQRYNGSGWVTPTGGQGYPGQFASSSTSSITVSDDVTLNVSPANSIGSLTVDNQALLSTSGNSNLTVTGNTTVSVTLIWIIFIPVPYPADLDFANGNLTIGGDLTIEATCSVTFGTGQLTVNGNTIIDAGGQLTNNGSFQSPGTLSIANFLASGVFENNGTASLTNTGAGVLSGAGRWTQGANSTLNYSGSTITVSTFQASATGNEVNYNAAGGQTVDNPSSSTYYHLTLSGSGVKASSSNYTIAGNLTIAGNAQFNVDNGNDDLLVGGNWTITSTNGDPFLQGTESVTFNGSTAQIISTAAGTETFYDLTFNNSFGASPQITIDDAVIVTGTLTMTDGNVNLNGNNFTIGTSAGSPGTLSHDGTSARGWMYGGNLRRYMANAATTIGGSDQNEGFFPLGSAADWRPFYVGKTNTSNSGGRITVSHTNSTSTSTVTGFPEGIVRRHNSYWTVSTSGVSAGTWSLRSGGANFGTIANVLHLRMSTSTGVVGNHSDGTGSTTDPRVNRTGLTYTQLSNNFHVASTNGTSSPLPIELLSFSAQLKTTLLT